MYDLNTIKKLNGEYPEPGENALDLAEPLVESQFDLADSIGAYEAGELDEDDILELFQYLVDTGLAWQLQGCYGRAAAHLIEVGLINQKGVK